MNNQIIVRPVDRINEMNLPELKDKFGELLGFETGKTSILNLRSRLIHRVQEICCGSISDEDKAVLKKIADKDPLSNLVRNPKSEITKLRGACYERVWKGVKYEVKVLGEKSFEFQGEVYNSLSAVARKITGTRWNGKVFFGVK